MTRTPATDQEIMISVYLKRDTHDNGMTLQEYTDGVIAGTQPVLDHDAFVYQFGATDDAIDLVTEWATLHELTVVEAHHGTATVKLLGIASQFNNIFGISLISVADIDRTYITFDGKLTIPSEIDDVVDFILGLDNSTLFFQNATEYDPSSESLDINSPNAYPTKAAVTPIQVATAYNLPSGDGYGGCVGLVALTSSGYRSGYTTSDVASSFSRIGLAAPKITTVIVDGAATTSTSDSESMLDIYCAGAVVPKANIAYYLAPNSSQGFLDCILSAANDTTNRPSALGISWGGTEVSDYLISGFQACVTQGITCFTAAGDNGANNYIVDSYPTTNAYQISAGGTSIYLNPNNSLSNETAWSNGGGGVSNVVSLPTWQAGLKFTSYASVGNVTGIPSNLAYRGYPDVSAPADPSTGYQFYVNGVLTQYGGTSASAPFLAGMITRLNVLTGKRIGFANAIFYANTSSFNDLTVGNNAGVQSGYLTTAGWDAVTGLGSPKGTEIYKLYKTGPTYPRPTYGFRSANAGLTGSLFPRINTGTGRNNTTASFTTTPIISFNITPSTTSTTFNGSVTYNITSANFGTGTLYWDTITVPASARSVYVDNTTTNSIVISNNSATITRSFNTTTNGGYSLTFNLRSSIRGTIVAFDSTVKTTPILFSSPTLTASRTNAQLGGRTDYTGSANTNSAVSVVWTINTNSVSVSATGIPFHSYYNSAAANIPAIQNYSKSWVYRGGTNTTGTQTATGGGKIGLWINGISMFNPSAQGGAPGGYTSFTNWHYNAAYEAGVELGYTFGEDDAGGHAAPPHEYHYHDGSMLVNGAWTSGTGHTSGIYGATGLSECSVFPYLYNGLTHSDGHSKIVGISADGYPVYGPYGYSLATDASSTVRRMVSGYALNPTFVANNARTANGTTPPVNATYPLGMFLEDWSFVGGGDLDTHNGRYCVTPDYPKGTYAYFTAFNASMKPTYPYVIGNTYYSTPSTL
jgi:kumamolisin